MSNKNLLIGIIVVIAAIILSAFLLKTTSPPLIVKSTTQIKPNIWQNIELKDINSGETFKISDFDKPVLLESFAVWCPTCTKQQKEIKSLHKEVGNAVISISLDTDPNEDESKIKQHSKSNGFNWRYAIAPAELTQSLIDEFGVSIVNAPSAPVILICKNGSFKKLDSGVKKASELKSEIAAC